MKLLILCLLGLGLASTNAFADSSSVLTAPSSVKAVSNEDWADFCATQKTSSSSRGSCEKVNEVCEMTGFKSQSCMGARYGLMSAKDARKK